MLALSVLLPASALTRYDDHGDPAYTVGEQVLLVLRRLRWATKSELNEALGIDVDWHDASQRAACAQASSALQHYVRVGKVLVRVVARTRQYRLNPNAFSAVKPLRGRALQLARRAGSRP